jgi:hypothetical protein
MEEYMANQEKKLEEMEKPWEEKLREQQEKDEKLRLEKDKEDEDNKRAPHLTNMNEDIQLSGKMYYSLKDSL